MQANIKIGDEDIPSIFQLLGLSDPRQSDANTPGTPPFVSPDVRPDSQPTKLSALQRIIRSSQGDVPHPLMTGPDAATVPQDAGGPAQPPMPAPGVVMPPPAGMPPVPPPTAPRSLADIIKGPPPGNYVMQDAGGPILPPDAGPIASRDYSALPDMGTGRPAVRGTFQDQHPTLYKILRGITTTAEGGLAGAQYANVGQGFEAGHEITDPIRKQMQEAALAKSQADTGNVGAEAQLHRAQAAAAGQQVTINTPQGPVTGPLSLLKSTYPAMFAAQSRENVAHIAANNKLALQDLKQSIDNGDIKWIKPIVDNQGRAVLGAFDKHGDLMKTLDHSIGPAWLQPTVRSSVDIKEDGNGGYMYIPKTSVTRRIFDGGAGSQSVGNGNRPQLNQGAGAPQPQVNGTPSAGAGGARPVPTGGVRPVIAPGGGQAGGKTSRDAGYAYDPSSGQTVLTTRMEAPARGLQDFRKVPQSEIEKDRKTVVRLQDVDLKTDRYANDFQSDISTSDRMNMAAIISDDRLHLGISKTEIPTGWLGKLADSEFFQNMSPAARMRTIDYFQMREAMSGYSSVLSGSSRSSDKNLQLQLEALPSPLWTPDDAQKGFQRWRENLGLVKQGLPVLPGVNDKPRQGGNQQQPNGGIQPGAIAQHADGSEWKFNGGNSADIRNWTQTKPAPRR